MILFLLLLILAAAGVAVYANQNTGTHGVTFLQWHWAGVQDWVPVAVTAAVIGGLFLLYMIYSGLVHGVRVGSMRRRVSTREQAINDMRGENQRLREENARLRGENRGVDRGLDRSADRERVVDSRDRVVDGDRERVVGDREPVGAGADRDRTTPPYRPRASFGERVRAFFSGREPSSY